MCYLAQHRQKQRRVSSLPQHKEAAAQLVRGIDPDLSQAAHRPARDACACRIEYCASRCADRDICSSVERGGVVWAHVERYAYKLLP